MGNGLRREVLNNQLECEGLLEFHDLSEFLEPCSICAWEVLGCDPRDFSSDFPFEVVNLGIYKSFLLEMVFGCEFMVLFVLLLLLDHALLLEVEEFLKVVWRELATDPHLLFLTNLLKAVKQKLEVLCQNLRLSLRYIRLFGREGIL